MRELHELNVGLAVEAAELARTRRAEGVAVAASKSSLVDIVTDPAALSMTPNITWDMMKGFTAAATKTVLDGGVGRMIDLARSNLRHIGGAASITFK